VESIRKEAVVAKFKVIFQYFLEEAKNSTQRVFVGKLTDIGQ
jgi:hypothetical protein